jgi:hypothetical protein
MEYGMIYDPITRLPVSEDVVYKYSKIMENELALSIAR